jgi:hypothetical protein
MHGAHWRRKPDPAAAVQPYLRKEVLARSVQVKTALAEEGHRRQCQQRRSEPLACMLPVV